LRAVVDTNVLIARLLWHGPPHELLGHSRNGTFGMISSPTLQAEFADTSLSPACCSFSTANEYRIPS
jgi:predicted nucleic acid-binding protein